MNRHSLSRRAMFYDDSHPFVFLVHFSVIFSPASLVNSVCHPYITLVYILLRMRRNEGSLTCGLKTLVEHMHIKQSSRDAMLRHSCVGNQAAMTLSECRCLPLSAESGNRLKTRIRSGRPGAGRKNPTETSSNLEQQQWRQQAETSICCSTSTRKTCRFSMPRTPSIFSACVCLDFIILLCSRAYR